jgi:hypothetical protein
MSLELCPNNYCGNNKNQIDGDCHDLDYQAGNKIIIQKDGMPRCWCVCSCLAVDTPISTPTGTIKVQDVVANKTEVLAAGRNMKFTPYLVTQASRSAPGITEHTIYLHYRLSDGAMHELVVSRDHVFLLSTGELTRADRLSINDQLMDRNAKPVQLLEVLWGSYDGIFYEFATKMEPPDPELTGHLILTNGVISGDFAVQAFVNLASPTHVAQPAAHTPLRLVNVTNRPVVGSREWRAANSKPAPVAHTAALASAAAKPVKVNTGNFVSAALKKIVVPPHASSFLPPLQAAFLEEFAPKRDYNDPYYEQMGTYIEKFFSGWYPDVTYQVDWYSDEVNAHSWVSQGKKNVLLIGGLCRIVGFDFEGICLAIAHELGHFYGHCVDPKSGVTCEGEADYWGAKIILRKVWFGEFYPDNTTKAISQLTTLFNYLHLAGSAQRPPAMETDKLGNKYPPNQCRIDTFKAAMALDLKPACAACPGEIATSDKAAAQPA